MGNRTLAVLWVVIFFSLFGDAWLQVVNRPIYLAPRVRGFGDTVRHFLTPIQEVEIVPNVGSEGGGVQFSFWNSLDVVGKDLLSGEAANLARARYMGLAMEGESLGYRPVAFEITLFSLVKSGLIIALFIFAISLIFRDKKG